MKKTKVSYRARREVCIAQSARCVVLTFLKKNRIYAKDQLGERLNDCFAYSHHPDQARQDYTGHTYSHHPELARHGYICHNCIGHTHTTLTRHAMTIQAIPTHTTLNWHA